MDTHKKCCTCKVEKEVSEFHKDGSRKDGLNAQCKDCKRQVYEEHREERAERSRRYYKENKEAIAAHRKQHRQENREFKNHQRNKYRRNRYATDPAYALIDNHRSRITQALEGKGKAESSIELLGCTPLQYRHHIESKFTKGMGWNQRGLWHVDHYHPLAAFDMTLKKHQKYAFHWSNCRPMWAEDNLKKSDNYCPKELSTYLNSKLPKYEDIHTL